MTPPVQAVEGRGVVAVVFATDNDCFLRQSLGSLYAQSHPPQEVLLVTRASFEPPQWLESDFPAACVVEADEGASDGAVLNWVVDVTAADAYLIQGGSDWSRRDRLGRLLHLAEQDGADVVGSSFVVVHRNVPDAAMVTRVPGGTVAFVSDVDDAVVVEPTTMLFTRDIFDRIGGFSGHIAACSLDDFVLRAAVESQVANVPAPLYFKRDLVDRARTAPSGRSRSVIERVVKAALLERARDHAVALAKREEPDVTLHDDRILPAVAHRSGPEPGARPRTAAQVTHPPPRSCSDQHEHQPQGPVLVVAGLPSLARFVAACLAQHSELVPVTVTSWIIDVAETAARRLRAEHVGALSPQQELAAEEATYAAARASVDALFLGKSGNHVRANSTWVGAVPADRRTLLAIAALYPDARLIHVVRGVDDSVASHLSAGSGADADTLYAGWLENTRAILDMRQLLDERRVLLVRFEDLDREPEPVMSACLEFLGLPYEGECLFPLAGGRDGSVPPVVGEVPFSRAQPEARLLSLALTGRRTRPSRGSQLSEITRMLAEPRAPTTAALDAVQRPRPSRDPNPYAASHDLVARLTSPESVIAVVSRGDERAIHFPGRARGWHFPQSEDGTYLGYHPRDGADAIAHLEMIRERGAEFLLIPVVFEWWLVHYEDLRFHLEQSYQRLPSIDGEGSLFDLRHQLAKAAAARPSERET